MKRNFNLLFNSTLNKKFKLNQLQKKLFSLNLHEYQAQALLKTFNINTPRGEVIQKESDVNSALEKIGKTTGYAVKAQVHAGGRGKGFFLENNFKGGVHVLDYNASKVKEVVGKMLGNTLRTHQNPGIKCSSLFIVEKVDVVKERYFSITLDRTHQSPVLIASLEGGMDIEQTAEKNPSAIKILPVNITKGLTKDQAVQFARDLKYESEDLVNQAADIFMKLYDVFVSKDCLMIEINPLATVRNPETKKEEVMVIDSKVTIDDNASFRQKELASIIDNSDKNPIEKEAESYGLNFIRLDGDIGCLVNGAGLAMATMDIIKLHGGAPANFLDVGGGADMEAMIQALRLLNLDTQVKSILVNIFGGILRCDDLVNAIITGTKKYDLKKPIVLRLKGTNSKEAADLIRKSNFSNIQFCDDLDKATKLVVDSRI